jgi:hypothetical protein
MAILVGLAFCFFGYRYFLYLMPAWGFYAGFILGAHAFNLATNEPVLGSFTSWLVAIIAGLVFAALSFILFPLALAVLAGTLGYWVGTGIMTLLGVESGWFMVFIGLVGAGAAIALIFVLKLLKWLIIIYTSLAGAMALLSGILMLIGRIGITNAGWGSLAAVVSDQWFWGLVWLALAGAGIGYQTYSTRDFTFDPQSFGKLLVRN